MEETKSGREVMIKLTKTKTIFLTITNAPEDEETFLDCLGDFVPLDPLEEDFEEVEEVLEVTTYETPEDAVADMISHLSDERTTLNNFIITDYSDVLTYSELVEKENASHRSTLN